MKVLVTGAGGLIGRAVTTRLQGEGVPLVVLGRKRPDHIDEGDFIACDLLRDDIPVGRLSAAAPTHLLHLAWTTEHGRFWTAPDNADWVPASIRLFDAFATVGGRHCVAAGSCAEYDLTRGLCVEDETPLAPATPYGEAKVRACRVLSDRGAGSGITLVWARVFLLYGPGEDRRRLVPSIIDALSGKCPPFSVSKKALRDYLHLSDVADGFLKLLRNGTSGCYNLSSGEALSVEHMVRAVADALSVSPDPLLDMPERTGSSDPPLIAGDNGRLRALGWGPKVNLAQGLSSYIADGRANSAPG